MTYQQILKDKFARRVSVNSRYSLRAYASLLGLAPSKLSEIFSGKKGLSSDRAEDVCDRLKLSESERETFLLSVRSQHSRVKRDREFAKARLHELTEAQVSQRAKTQQRNAWYFGAIKALGSITFDPRKVASALAITQLQVENAERFLHRMRRFHPSKRVLSFEPASLIKKLNEDYASGALVATDAEFAILTPDQAESLLELIRAKIEEFSESARVEKQAQLNLFFIGLSRLAPKEDLC